MKHKNGLLIALEGTDGCGKTTQTSLLYREIYHKYAADSPKKVYSSAEPSYLVREDVTQASISDLSRLLLVAAGRAQTHIDLMKPAMERGDVVITDRYFLSTLVYQFKESETAWITHYYAAENLHPDCTIVLNCPSEDSFKRIARVKTLDILENVSKSEIQRRNDHFVELATTLPDMHVVDGRKPIHDVHDDIWRIVEPMMQKHFA